MSNFLLDLSFGVKRPDGYVSDIWRAYTTRLGDFRLATRSITGVEEYSFNKSGMCRSAHSGAEETPEALRDRAGFKWRRAVTPPRGSGRAARVAWIAFPTDYLSRPSVEDDGEIFWIAAAPASGATYVEFAYAAEPEQGIRGVLDVVQDRTLVRCAALPNGETLVIFCYHADWENKDLRVPGNGVAADVLFSADDPLATGRPLRHRFGPMPKDEEAVLLLEMGGTAVTN
ncbi:MAG: hypothetical protein IH604_06905 [Burkholderiales bacterium]|nr:hypothetical protein [Burkholderiales bacterium]